MTTTALEVTTDLPAAVKDRGITVAQWRTLCLSLFPGAKPASVLLVWDYCVARRLDPLKKPCHIVAMDVKVGDRYESRDVVLPGIYELRTTAHRTGQYLGHSLPRFSGDIDVKGVKAPESCELTVYRWHPGTGEKVAFPVTVFFREVVATTRDGKPNARWTRAPRQMLLKCTEAAALREAFPDEIGGEHTFEELDGQRAVEASVVEPPAPALPKPEHYDDWLEDLTALADNGLEALEQAFSEAEEARRTYLTTTAPETWEALKTRAQAVGGDA